MLKINNISFSYQESKVLEDISFSVKKGTHLSIMGESGSGKSTLLKAIYGLLHLDSGEISWKKEKVLGPNFNLVPGEKYMKYVAQDFNLMPFTSVRENIAEFLSVFERETHDSRVKELLEVIEMTPFADVKVKNLSGGQQQRVALARALAQEPQILLLDEPFSSIDQFKKNQLRHRLFPYLKEKKITVLNATHDPNDVLSFASNIIVLRNGKIIVDDAIKDQYHKPKNYYVASLFGQVNKLPISLLKEYSEVDASILVYPHEFEISRDSGFEVYVINNHFKGSHYLIEAVAENSQTVFFTNPNALKIHARVYLNVSLLLVNKRIVLKS